MTYSMSRPKATRPGHHLDDARALPGEIVTSLQVVAVRCEPLPKSNHWSSPPLTGRHSLLIWTNWNGGSADGASVSMETVHVHFEGDLWCDRVGACNHQL